MAAPLLIDTMRELASGMATPDVPLADQPRIYAQGESGLAADIADTMNINDITQFAAERNGYDPDELRALGIVLIEDRPKTILLGDAGAVFRAPKYTTACYITLT